MTIARPGDTLSDSAGEAEARFRLKQGIYGLTPFLPSASIFTPIDNE